jgi:O-methyltransferase
LTNNEKIKNDKLKYNNCYEDVVNTFSNFKNIKIVKGTIPAILKSIKIKKISFLHIDLNSSISEIEAIEFLWNKMSPNSIILLDDYAYSGYGDTKKAWDKFCSKKDYEILSLPTGQGLILL